MPSPRLQSLRRSARLVLLCCALLACQFAQVFIAPPTPTPTETPIPPLATATPPPSTATLQNTPTPSRTPPNTPAPTSTLARTPTPTLTSTPRPRTPTPTLMPASKRGEIFDQVWKTVKERYVDPAALNDWDALRQEYEPKALTAANAQAFYDVVAQMVAQLKDGHTYYLSPWAAAERDIIAQGARSKEDIGILYALDAGTLLVTYVIPDSPADAAGLQRRDRILTIGDRRTNDARLLRGAEGTSITLTVRAPNQATRTVVVRHYEHSQRVSPMAHRLTTDNSIGYLYIPTFRPNDMDKQVENRLKELLEGEPLKGLIIDVRSNGGGNRSVTQNILGQLTEGELGRFYMVNRSSAFTVGKGSLLPQLKPIPLAVLIDGRSASASELTSGGLQWQGRARVFGVKSYGSLRVTYFHNMPDGSRLGLSQETFKLPNGFEPDRNGITPDVVLAPNWGDYAERDDPHIMEAMKWLQSQRTP